VKIEIRKSILRSNDEKAQKNARLFESEKLAVINVMGSPGAGKTSFILKLAKVLGKKYTFGVIEADVASRIDADKISSAGIPVFQINTDGGCHLEASMIPSALKKLEIKGPGFLLIENIGNLICPSEFDLGEALRIVISSVPEGHDKPAKYPGIFSSADAVILNKIDLLPYLDFDREFFVNSIKAVNDEVPVFEVSSKTGRSIRLFSSWVEKISKKWIER